MDSSENTSEQTVSDLVAVINRVSDIENLINQIIHAYVGPREHAWLFVWSVILDTSVMPLGSKVKVVMAVSHELKFKLNSHALHRLVSLRNAFAHNATDANLVIGRSSLEEEPYSYNMLYVLNGSGKIDSSKRHEAFEEFNKCYTSAEESLGQLLGLVNAQIVEHRSYTDELRLQQLKSQSAREI